MKESNTIWGYQLPAKFPELYRQDDFDAIRLSDQEEIELPSPVLELEEIRQQESLREDWEIPEGFVPFMGDMHDLVCLDYTESDDPGVVLINDERVRTKLADTFDDFLDGVYSAGEKDVEPPKIVEEGTWFNFSKSANREQE